MPGRIPKVLLCCLMIMGIGLFSFAIADDLQPNSLQVPNSIPKYTVETIDEVVIKDNHYLVNHRSTALQSPMQAPVCSINGNCNMSKSTMYQAPAKSYSNVGTCSGNARGGGIFGRAAVRQQRRAERSARRGSGGC